MLYCQAVPGAVGISGAAAAAASKNAAAKRILKNGAPGGRALPKLGNLGNLQALIA